MSRSEWVENDWSGKQHRPPSGLEPDALIEVELRDGAGSLPSLCWAGSEADIIRYRLADVWDIGCRLRG